MGYNTEDLQKLLKIAVGISESNVEVLYVSKLLV